VKDKGEKAPALQALRKMIGALGKTRSSSI
jgi:hypothetical protein